MLRTVHTQLGDVEGIASPDPAVTVFRGIPFAKPPVGQLRWRAPQPVKAWEGVLKAHDFAAIAIQPTPGASNEFYDKEWGMDPAIAMSEDCLYLNIWTPALRGRGEVSTDAKLPVMVWIYGGAYQTGCTAEPEFDASQLARLGVVVVSVAYRLNVFGFFAHEALREEADELESREPYANFGLLDQQAGIRWVKEHIAAFGGDSDNITVFGQSAGSSSTLAQVCTPTRGRLFHRAIMQSGAGLGLFNERQASFEEVSQTGARLWQLLGVHSLQEARTVSAETLFEAAQKLEVPPDSGLDGQWSMMVNWVPCVDSRFLTDDFLQLLKQGNHKGCDLMLGNTTGEFVGQIDGQELPVGEIGTLKLLHAWLQYGGNVPYYYRFDVQLPGDNAGAFHSSDLWFTFNSLRYSWRPFEGWHYALANRMSRAWAAFATAGNPNAALSDSVDEMVANDVVWLPSNRDEVPAMQFSEHSAMVTHWVSEEENNIVSQWLKSKAI